MTLNGGNAPLAEINKNSGAHQKNFNEDRPILSAHRAVIFAIAWLLSLLWRETSARYRKAQNSVTYYWTFAPWILPVLCSSLLRAELLLPL